MRRIQCGAAGLFLAWATLAGADSFNPYLAKNLAFPEVKGVVLDAVTGAPLANVDVIAFWHAVAYGPHRSTSVCLRVEAATTNAEGRFSIVAPLDSVYRRDYAQHNIDVRIHRAGMQEAHESDAKGRAMKAEEKTVRSGSGSRLRGDNVTLWLFDVKAQLFPVTRASHDRLRDLARLTNRIQSCTTRGAAGPLHAFFDGIAAEGASLAKTRYEKNLAALLAKRAEKAPYSSWTDDEVSIREAMSKPDLDDLNARDGNDLTHLMRAVMTPDVGKVRALLARGADPNETTEYTDSGGTALSMAMGEFSRYRSMGSGTAVGPQQIFEILLDDPRTDPDARNDPDGATPLLAAVTAGQEEFAIALLARGADPNSPKRTGEHNVLAMAALNVTRTVLETRETALRIVRAILATGRAKLDLPDTYWGHTPLATAVSSGDEELLRILIAAGADPNAPERGGWTPLIRATSNALINPQWPKYTAMVAKVASLPGVRFDVAWQGKTALQMAQEANRVDLVKLLAPR